MLYFAYTARIAPDLLTEAAPSAEFQFIAHLPETELLFPITNQDWEGALPSIRPRGGNTVWGAVFEVPKSELKGLGEAEKAEGRIPSEEFKAVDRQGRSYAVLTHVSEAGGETVGVPSSAYMEIVVNGARHWELPTGWVAGLAEHIT